MLVKNESQMDRAIRVILGLILLVVGSQIGGWTQIVLYILAIVALLTAVTGYCHLYKLLGICTACHNKPEEVSTTNASPEKAEEKPEAKIEEEKTNEETEETAEEEITEEIKEEEPQETPTEEEIKEETPVKTE